MQPLPVETVWLPMSRTTMIWVNIVLGNGVFRDVLWRSLESKFTTSAQVVILYNEFENYIFQILPHHVGSNELIPKNLDAINQ